MGDALPAVDLGTGKTAVAIASGDSHTCALLNDETIKCWGSNQYGQLGLGDTNWRGDEAGEMGDNLPAVDLGPGSVPTAVSAGTSRTCVLLKGGSVKCWGYALAVQGSLGDEPDEMGANLPAIDLSSSKTAVAIKVGSHSYCAFLDDGSVKCWGLNVWAQLGLGDLKSRGDDPADMGDNLPALDLGAGQVISSLSIGIRHACALLTDGHIKCWGTSDYGEIGLGDTIIRGDQPNEMGDNLPFVEP
jgi:alpha-tubulin suppressor-like RCC1 family protein